MTFLTKYFRLSFHLFLIFSVSSICTAEQSATAGAGESAQSASPSISNSAASPSSTGTGLSKSAPTSIITPATPVLDSQNVPLERDGKKDTAPNKELDKTVNETPAESDFQKFVALSVGRALPLYGYELFRKSPDTFAPVDNIPVTPDYTIGPGDELVVHIWGQVETNQSVVVDRDGMINIPKVGPISVVGVRYQNLDAHIKAAVGRMFRNFELSVSLGKLRSIQVFVVGQAARPGNYTISSLSTLVNALFA